MNGMHPETAVEFMEVFGIPTPEDKAPSPTPCEALAQEVLRLRERRRRWKTKRWTFCLVSGRDLVVYGKTLEEAQKKLPETIPNPMTGVHEKVTVAYTKQSGYVARDGTIVTEDQATLEEDNRKAPGS